MNTLQKLLLRPGLALPPSHSAGEDVLDPLSPDRLPLRDAVRTVPDEHWFPPRRPRRHDPWASAAGCQRWVVPGEGVRGMLAKATSADSRAERLARALFEI